MKSGAGFMTWNPEQIKAARSAYDKRLKAAFDVLKLE
jgi:3-hydroxybutyryl-CoA dehydrogenase